MKHVQFSNLSPLPDPVDEVMRNFDRKFPTNLSSIYLYIKALNNWAMRNEALSVYPITLENLNRSTEILKIWGLTKQTFRPVVEEMFNVNPKGDESDDFSSIESTETSEEEDNSKAVVLFVKAEEELNAKALVLMSKIEEFLWRFEQKVPSEKSLRKLRRSVETLSKYWNKLTDYSGLQDEIDSHCKDLLLYLLDHDVRSFRLRSSFVSMMLRLVNQTCENAYEIRTLFFQTSAGIFEQSEYENRFLQLKQDYKFCCAFSPFPVDIGARSTEAKELLRETISHYHPKFLKV